MKKIILLLFLLATLVISCKKQIEGTIVDNFNKPLSNVEVTISNSEYKAYSDVDGYFAIDYAPGKITLVFQKDGYLSSKENISITEKQSYPLSKTTLIKKPQYTGVYLSSEELDDYIELKLSDTKRSHPKRGSDVYTLVNHDSLTIIKLKNLDNIVMYNIGESIQKVYLGQLGENSEVVTIKDNLLLPTLHMQSPIKINPRELRPNYSFFTFEPQYNVNYCLISTKTVFSITIITSVRIFRFEHQ